MPRGKQEPSWPGIAVRRTASLPLAYDPAIHPFAKSHGEKWMDPRVKPGGDGETTLRQIPFIPSPKTRSGSCR